MLCQSPDQGPAALTGAIPTGRSLLQFEMPPVQGHTVMTLICGNPVSIYSARRGASRLADLTPRMSTANLPRIDGSTEMTIVSVAALPLPTEFIGALQ
jgi:hypothetical protein